MNVLVLGSGGREHVITWKLTQNLKVNTVFVSPRNAGTELTTRCKSVPFQSIQQSLNFSITHSIDLTVVNLENLLVEGVVDTFTAHNQKIIDAGVHSAKLERSKSFAKDFMLKNRIKTTKFKVFTDFNSASKYVSQKDNFPIVVKADGLATGKGVLIYNLLKETLEDLKPYNG